MKPIVYIDILFLINFFMDTIIIYSTALILRQKIHIVRLAGAATFSALYATVMFFPQLSIVYSVFFKTIVFFLSVIIAFPIHNIFELLKKASIFFVTNSIFGGITFLLIFFTDFGVAMGTVVSNGEIYFNISTPMLLVCSIIAYVAVYIFSNVRKNAIKREVHTVTLQLEFDKKTLSVKAFADTGCMSTVPLGETPVIILSHNAAKELTGHAFITAISRNFSEPEDKKYFSRYRIIPFKTIDSGGIMDAFVPDYASINGNKLDNVIIGISKISFSENSGYAAIFNPDILEPDNTKNSGGLSYVK